MLYSKFTSIYSICSRSLHTDKCRSNTQMNSRTMYDLESKSSWQSTVIQHYNNANEVILPLAGFPQRKNLPNINCWLKFWYDCLWVYYKAASPSCSLSVQVQYTQTNTSIMHIINMTLNLKHHNNHNYNNATKVISPLAGFPQRNNLFITKYLCSMSSSWTFDLFSSSSNF